MFQMSTTPTIRSTQNCNYSLQYWSYFLCSYLPAMWPSFVTLEGGSRTVPETVVTVLCTPDDGCGWYPKHRVNLQNIWLLCVASDWTIINIVIFISRIVCTWHITCMWEAWYVKITVFWDLTKCSLVQRYKSFRKSQLFLSYWRSNLKTDAQAHPKSCCLSTRLHDVNSWP